MKEQYIKTIREACIKANPDKDFIIWVCSGCNTVYGEYVNGCPRCWDARLTRSQNINKYPNRKVESRECSIHLADVLMVIKKKDQSISLTLWHNGLQISSQANILWNLKETLENQSEETLKFISELLKL